MKSSLNIHQKINARTYSIYPMRVCVPYRGYLMNRMYDTPFSVAGLTKLFAHELLK